jgi:hypothetical protein
MYVNILSEKPSVVKKPKRTFQIMDYPSKSHNYGHYTSSFPGGAAHKALNFLAKKYDTNNSSEHNQLKFYLIDTTSNGKYNNKVYCYVGSRVKLNTPINVMIKGKNVKYKYKTIVTRCQDIHDDI